MLSFTEKVNVLKSYIDSKNGSYSDGMKVELDIFFFENEFPLDFLHDFNNEKELQNKIDVIIHQMIMYEDEEELQEIIYSCF